MITYSLPLIPNKVSWSIINLSDRLIIMHTIGESAAGLYAVSYKFPTLMDTVYGFFYQAWKESSARILGNTSQDAFYNAIYAYLKDFLYAIVLGMTAFMPLVFRILVNEAFFEAMWYVPILLLATYFSNISGFYGGIFTAYKDTGIMGTTTAAAAAINLIVNLALIQTFGLYAAAISTLVANLAAYLYRRIKVRGYIALKEDWKKRLASILATALIVAMFYVNSLPSIIVGCCASLIYAAVMNRSLILRLWRKLRRDLAKKNAA